jgi:hypothetical protein
MAEVLGQKVHKGPQMRDLEQLLNQPGFPTLRRAETRYPEAHDTPTQMDGYGEIKPEVGGHSTTEMTTEEIFNLRVKQLVESAGHQYHMPEDQPTPPPKYLVAAVRRLERIAPLLQRAVELTDRREFGDAVINALLKDLHGDESDSGSGSGSASGHHSGSDSDNIYEKWGRILRVIRMRRHATGSISGSISGDTGSISSDASGSQSGDKSKSTILRALAGHQDDALKLTGRR